MDETEIRLVRPMSASAVPRRTRDIRTQDKPTSMIYYRETDGNSKGENMLRLFHARFVAAIICIAVSGFGAGSDDWFELYPLIGV